MHIIEPPPSADLRDLWESTTHIMKRPSFAVPSRQSTYSSEQLCEKTPPNRTGNMCTVHMQRYACGDITFFKITLCQKFLRILREDTGIDCGQGEFPTEQQLTQECHRCMMAGRTRAKEYESDWEVLHSPEFDQYEHAHEEGEEVDNGMPAEPGPLAIRSQPTDASDGNGPGFVQDTIIGQPGGKDSEGAHAGHTVEENILPSSSSITRPLRDSLEVGNLAGKREVRRVNRWPLPSQLITMEVLNASSSQGEWIFTMRARSTQQVRMVVRRSAERE